MPAELPAAVLTISRLDQSRRKLRVDLTPRTPLDHDALRAALVASFVTDPDVEPVDFDLTVSGTFGAPVFLLEEREELFGGATEIT